MFNWLRSLIKRLKWWSKETPKRILKEKPTQVTPLTLRPPMMIITPDLERRQ